MKKIFTLCLALFCATATFAQDEENEAKGTFEFVDKDGNVIADGSTITRNELEESEVGDMQVNSGLYVKQMVNDVDGVPLAVGMHVDITRIDNGGLQYCFPTNCFLSERLESKDTGIAAINGTKTLLTEWIPALDDDTEEPIYGQATATFTLHAYQNFGSTLKPDYYDLGVASSVTVNFVYADPTGIDGVADDAHATVVARYAADGTRLSAPQKGLNIEKLSNGKTVKRMYTK